MRWDACQIIKALQKGQYDLAISKAVKKLRKDKSKGKQVKVLEEAYRIAQQRDFEAINFIKKEGSPDKWGEIHGIYSRIQRRQNMVKILLIE